MIFTSHVLGCIRMYVYSNGRWRTEWTVSFSGPGSAELKGVMRVQVCFIPRFFVLSSSDVLLIGVKRLYQLLGSHSIRHLPSNYWALIGLSAQMNCVPSLRFPSCTTPVVLFSDMIKYDSTAQSRHALHFELPASVMPCVTA